MIILEFKLKGASTQYRAIDEAIRTTQFIRNKCVRLWQDTWGITRFDLSAYAESYAWGEWSPCRPRATVGGKPARRTKNPTALAVWSVKICEVLHVARIRLVR